MGISHLQEAYGVRLPLDYNGEVPSANANNGWSAEGEYIVFEHGAFDFETENTIVEAKTKKQ